MKKAHLFVAGNEQSAFRWRRPNELRTMQDRRCFLPDVETTAMSACGSPVFPEAPPGGSVVLDFVIMCPHCGREKTERMSFKADIGGIQMAPR